MHCQFGAGPQAAVCRTLAEAPGLTALLTGPSPAGAGPRPSVPVTLPSAVHRAGEGKALGARHVSIEDHEGHDRPREGLHGLADATSNNGRPDDVVRDKSATGMATVFEKSPFEEPVNPEQGGLQLGSELSCQDFDQQAFTSRGALHSSKSDLSAEVQHRLPELPYDLLMSSTSLCGLCIDHVQWTGMGRRTADSRPVLNCAALH